MAADAKPPEAEGPPVGGTWRRLYWLLIAELAALTVGFHLLTRWAA